MQQRIDLGFYMYLRPRSLEASRLCECVSDQVRTAACVWVCDQLWMPWQAQKQSVHWLQEHLAVVLLGARRSHRQAGQRVLHQACGMWCAARARRRQGQVQPLVRDVHVFLLSLLLVELLDEPLWSSELMTRGTWTTFGCEPEDRETQLGPVLD